MTLRESGTSIVFETSHSLKTFVRPTSGESTIGSPRAPANLWSTTRRSELSYLVKASEHEWYRGGLHDAGSARNLRVARMDFATERQAAELGGREEVSD